jgi:hypothetical protein
MIVCKNGQHMSVRDTCEDPNNPRLIRYTYFANVHVGAIRVQLGVIVREEGCVHIVGRGHNVAIVIGLHHVRSRAIVARSPQAQGLARKEVRTIRVDPRVYDRKLIATNRSGLGGMSRLSLSRGHVVGELISSHKCHQPERCTCACTTWQELLSSLVRRKA